MMKLIPNFIIPGSVLFVCVRPSVCINYVSFEYGDSPFFIVRLISAETSRCTRGVEVISPGEGEKSGDKTLTVTQNSGNYTFRRNWP